MRRNLVAHYVNKKNISSKKFSLKSFSPQYFKSIKGYYFSLEKEKEYMIQVFSQGDRINSPIFIKVNKYGELKVMKIEDVFQI